MADLVTRFFAFYHFDFQWGREVVSTRLGRRLWANDKIFEQLRGRFGPRLHIEDPYKLERNLHCVLGPEVEEAQLRMAIAEAWNTLQMGGTPVGLGTDVVEGFGLPAGRVQREPAASEGEAEGTDEAVDGEELWKKRTESAASSPDSSASTASGGLKVGESSGGESQGSDDEKVRKPRAKSISISQILDEDERTGRRASQWSSPDPLGSFASWMAGFAGLQGATLDVEEKDAGEKWQWWRHLGEIGAAHAADAEEDASPKKKSSNKQPKMPKQTCHNVSDLEGKLTLDVIKNGIATPMGGRAFASPSTRAIAARVSKLVFSNAAANGVTYQ